MYAIVWPRAAGSIRIERLTSRREKRPEAQFHLVMRNFGESASCTFQVDLLSADGVGIGYVTALEFASRGARVILACRNEIRAEDAQRRIIKETNNQNVIYKLLDLSSLDSVRAFADDINATEDRIDILVNNAGAGGLGNRHTKDGIQITLQVNHVSAFLLTHLLLDKIKKSAPSRIVNVSSIAAKFCQLVVDDMNTFPTNTNAMFADTRMYSYSKACNILFTIKLANKLRNTDVTVNALHPGAVDTEICRRIPELFKMIINQTIGLYLKTAEEGAQTTIYVATSPKLEGVTGKLFDNCKEIDIYSNLRDPDLADRAWKKCEELAKMKENEKIK